MTPLMYATKDNKTAIMDRMIELGADVGARNNVSLDRENARNNLKFLSSLISQRPIELGINIEATQLFKWTAGTKAAKNVSNQ